MEKDLVKILNLLAKAGTISPEAAKNAMECIKEPEKHPQLMRVLESVKGAD